METMGKDNHIKNSVVFLIRCMTDALTSNTSSLVCMLLAVPLKEHGSDLHYLLPIMLFYACMKTGVFLLQGTVHIDNPHKAMRVCIAMSVTGSLLLLGGNPSQGIYVVGAVFSGIGLSVFSCLYKRVAEENTAETGNTVAQQIISTAILVALAIWSIVSKKTGKFLVLYAWSAFLLIVGVYVWRMPGKKRYAGMRIFTPKAEWWLRAVPAVPLFFMMFAVSGYKSSGSRLLFFWMLSCLILFGIWFWKFDGRVLHRYSAQTAWLGAVRGFEMLYALVFLTVTGQGSMTMDLYVTIVAAGFSGPLMNLLFRKCRNSAKTVRICMALSLASLLAVISGNTVAMLAGVFLCVSFSTKAKRENLVYFRQDQDTVQDEYRMRQDKMYSLGNGTMQAYTLILFYLAGKLFAGKGNGLMQAYAISTETERSAAILHFGGCAAILSMLLLLVLVIKMPAGLNSKTQDKFNHKKEEDDQ